MLILIYKIGIYSIMFVPRRVCSLINEIPFGSQVPVERRTLPTDLPGPSRRRPFTKRHSPSAEACSSGGSSGGGGTGGSVVAGTGSGMQTSCSLPETPVFARGSDIPRTPQHAGNPTQSRRQPGWYAPTTATGWALPPSSPPEKCLERYLHSRFQLSWSNCCEWPTYGIPVDNYVRVSLISSRHFQLSTEQSRFGAGHNRHWATPAGGGPKSRMVSHQEGEPAATGIDRAPRAAEQRLWRTTTGHRGPEKAANSAHEHHTQQILRPK